MRQDPLNKEPLAYRDDLADPGAISVIRGAGVNRVDVLIVCNKGQLIAYLNACPHQGTPLETFDGHFFSVNHAHLLCSTHGAEFRVGDGLCIKGPCKGQALTPIRIFVDDEGAIFLADE